MQVRKEMEALQYTETEIAIAIGLLWMLRFVCSSLLKNSHNPKMHQGPDQARKMIYVCKILQNMSNNITFSFKEPHLQLFNDLIVKNIPILRNYLLELSVNQ
jgi:hypothetical protein